MEWSLPGFWGIYKSPGDAVHQGRNINAYETVSYVSVAWGWRGELRIERGEGEEWWCLAGLRRGFGGGGFLDLGFGGLEEVIVSGGMGVSGKMTTISIGTGTG